MENTENKIKFSDLGLSEAILKSIEKKGYVYPSPVQARVIPLLLNGDKDIIGQAQTGTGKTAAFGLPILEKLDIGSKNIQALILAPTRELAIQVAEEIKSFANSSVKIQLLYGGQNVRDELMGLKSGPHIVVGTPGRVIDHLTKRKSLKIESIKYFVLDEADEMLNIGFKDEIEEIIQHTPQNKKVLLFSATMPKSIKDIVGKYIKDHDFVSIQKEETTNKNIDQKVYKVSERDKFEALCRIIEVEFDFYGLIFCKTKLDVDELTSKLMSRGYKVDGIHGDVEQKQREKTLARFKNKTITILVATDVAARGIDVNNLTQVVNYALPDNPETYTHRIGRTGRAGNKGEAISFVSSRDLRMLSFIERVIKQKIRIEKLPEVSHVIEFKKKRLLNNIKEMIEAGEGAYYMSFASELLSLGTPEQVLATFLKEAYNTKFDEDHYTDIKEDEVFGRNTVIISRNNRDNRDNSMRVMSDGLVRLFIAKGRNDNFTPGTLIQFLEKEVGEKLGDIGRIEVMKEFSFANVSEKDASIILSTFKAKNPQKPIVVQAKERSDTPSEGGFKRSGGSFGRRSNSGFQGKRKY